MLRRVNLELSYLAVPVSCAHRTQLALHLTQGTCLLVAVAGRWSPGERDLVRNRCQRSQAL